jgi:hypothetical protein
VRPELAAEVPGYYEGEILVALGVVGTLLLVQAAAARGDGATPLRVAHLVAL